MVIRVLSIIFVLVGAILLWLDFSAYRGKQEFINAAVPAEGEVVETIRRQVSTRRGSSTKYYYKVRYAVGQGQSIEAVLEQGTSSPEYQVGERVPILYEPDHPRLAAINVFSMLWFDVALLGAFGGYFLAVGLCNLWITAKKALRIRTSVSLRELRDALRSGKLTRGSEYQGLLIAFTFVGFAMLDVAILIMFFSSTTTKVILGAMLLYAFVRILWGRKSGKPVAPQRPA
jgi:hypothetical protein